MDKKPNTQSSNKRIRRDYFDIAPNENPQRKHKPDDDTHSVILEVVEKRLWKVNIFDQYTDAATSIIRSLVALVFFTSVFALAEELLNFVPTTMFKLAWVEKLDAMIDPYKIPIYTGVIAVCVVWFSCTWLKKRICLLKGVRERNYVCKIITNKYKSASSADATLEVLESNAPEDWVRFEVYLNGKPLWTVIELVVEKS